MNQDNSNYDFMGYHLMANYFDCDPIALNDLKALEEKMKEAAIASKASVLKTCSHAFEPDGLTMLILLGESHVSIHTYPEHNSCFIDCFTCGEDCDPNLFEKVINNYLKPKTSKVKIFIRSDEIREKHLETQNN